MLAILGVHTTRTHVQTAQIKAGNWGNKAALQDHIKDFFLCITQNLFALVQEVVCK